MAPIVHGLEADYFEQINFVYLDVDDPANEVFKQALGYRVQPHFFLLDENGEIIQQWVGRVSQADFTTAFEAALK